MTLQFPVVLFDLDGTLIDGYPAITASVNALLADHGCPPLTTETIKPYVGRGLDVLLRAVIPNFDHDRDVAGYRRHYDRLMMTGTELLPGAKTLLHDLVKSGRRLGLCTNKLAAFAGRILQLLEIADSFSVVLGPEHVREPKPAPEMLLTAAGQLNIPPSEVLYIGDMTVDVEAGQAAGMTVWIVATGSDSWHNLQNSPAHRVFRNLNEVNEALFAAVA